MHPKIIIITSMTNPSHWYAGAHSHVEASELAGLERRLDVIYHCIGRYGETREIECNKYTYDPDWPLDEKLQWKESQGRTVVFQSSVLPPTPPPTPVQEPPAKKKRIEYNPFDSTPENWCPRALQFSEDDLPSDYEWGTVHELPHNPFIDMEAESTDKESTPNLEAEYDSSDSQFSPYENWIQDRRKNSSDTLAQWQAWDQAEEDPPSAPLGWHSRVPRDASWDRWIQECKENGTDPYRS